MCDSSLIKIIMTKKTTNVAEVKTVTSATPEVKKNSSKPNFKALEAQYNTAIGKYGSYAEFSEKYSIEKWNGEPLKTDRVYHLNKMGGLPILIIADNRRTIQRAYKMWTAMNAVGMTTPATLVRAHLLADWGMKLLDPVTLEPATPEQIANSYAILEGHGRHYAYMLGIAMNEGVTDYKPVDYKFIYNEYASPEEAGNAYVNTNEYMTRTTNKDRLAIAGARCSDPLVISCNRHIREDGCVAKGAYFWVYGREMSVSETAKLIKMEDDAPTFDMELVAEREKVYQAFKARFKNEGAEHVYRGVPAAKWVADKLKDKTTAQVIADSICDRVKNMGECLYTSIITAKSRKGKTKEQIIQAKLNELMK